MEKLEKQEKQEKQNLFIKIQSVANEIKYLDKDMSVGKGIYAYKAVSDLQTTTKVKDAEAKYRIISIPAKQELIHQEVVKSIGSDGKESIRFSFLIKMTTIIVNLDNTSEKIEIESYGHGLDTGDKGFGKAATYARKYALLNAYKIASGEDPDKFDSPKLNSEPTYSDKRIAVINYLNNNVNILLSTLQHYGLESIESAEEKQIIVMYETLKQKNKL